MATNSNKIIEVILVIEVILPFIIIPIIWKSLPMELSFHWGLSNKYAFPKTVVLFSIPVVNTLIWLFFLLLSKNKYINDGVSFFNRKYHYMRLAISSLLFVYFIIIVLINY